jgi:hypothetical protein
VPKPAAVREAAMAPDLVGIGEGDERGQAEEEVVRLEDEVGGSAGMRPPPVPEARGRGIRYATFPSGRRESRSWENAARRP